MTFFSFCQEFLFFLAFELKSPLKSFISRMICALASLYSNSVYWLPEVDGSVVESTTVSSTLGGVSAAVFGLASTFAFSTGSPLSSNSKLGIFLHISNSLPPNAPDIASFASVITPAAPCKSGGKMFFKAPVKTPAAKPLPKSFSIAATAAPTAIASLNFDRPANSACKFFGLGICETSFPFISSNSG